MVFNASYKLSSLSKFVLGPVLFNLYTIPLISLISASSISHLLYDDETQLFISFILQNISVCHKQPSVHYYSHLVLDVF